MVPLEERLSDRKNLPSCSAVNHSSELSRAGGKGPKKGPYLEVYLGVYGGDRAVVQDHVAGGRAADDDGVGLLLGLRRIVRRAAEVQPKLSVEQPRIRVMSGDHHQTEIRTVAIHLTTRGKV